MDEHIEWEPSTRDSYTGPSDRGIFGPTSVMSQVVRTATNLATIFLSILPLNFFEKISQWTDKYTYKDWVIEKVGNDRGGNKKQVRYLRTLPLSQIGSNARRNINTVPITRRNSLL